MGIVRIELQLREDSVDGFPPTKAIIVIPNDLTAKESERLKKMIDANVKDSIAHS